MVFGGGGAADVVVAELKKLLPLLTEFDSDLESSYVQVHN